MLRIIRADTKLLKGDYENASDLYMSAVEFFMPFDKSEAVELSHNLAHKLYETGRKSLAKTFHIGARLLEAILATDLIAEDRALRSKTRYRLSLLYRNASEHRSGPEALTLLQKAVNYAREGLSDLKEGDDPSQIIAMKISLGNCLFEVVKITKEPNGLSEANIMLLSAREQLIRDGSNPELLAYVHNSLGSSILEKLNYSDAEDEEETLTEAIRSFQAAIAAAEECGDPGIWGVANHNLGNALAGLARLSSKPEDRGFLYARAAAAVLAAIEIYPEARFPLNGAKAHVSLARIFFDMARTEQGEMLEACLIRSMNSWTVAQHFFTKEQFPAQWAETQMYMGAVYGAHAGIDGVTTKREDLVEAKQHLSEALDVFKSLGMQHKIEYCNRTLQHTVNQLKDIDE